MKTPLRDRIRDIGAGFADVDYQAWKQLYAAQSVFVVIDDWLIGWLWITGLERRQFCVLRIRPEQTSVFES